MTSWAPETNLSPRLFKANSWINLFELTGYQYLLVGDCFSHFTEVAHLIKAMSADVIDHCKAIFVWQSIPKIVLTDDGRQFPSCEFLQFSDSFGFNLTSRSPWLSSKWRKWMGSSEFKEFIQNITRSLYCTFECNASTLRFKSSRMADGKEAENENPSSASTVCSKKEISESF